MFIGVEQPSPEIVRGRSINGFPSLKLSEIATVVPTLQMIQPVWKGRLPDGTSFFVSAVIKFFSAP